MKNIISIIAGLLLVGVAAWYVNTKIVQPLRDEVDRYKNNFYLSNQTLDSLKLENGNMRYSLNAIKLQNEELETVNETTAKALEDSKLKIKNMSHVLQAKTNYIIKLEGFSSNLRKTVDSLKFQTNTFDIAFKDKWIDLEMSVLHRKDKVTNKQTLDIQKFTEKIHNDFTCANEIVWSKKKWWQFWKSRKPIGIKTHIVLSNPYSKLDSVVNYQLMNGTD